MAEKTIYDLAEKVKELKTKMLAIPPGNWEAFKAAFYRYQKARDQYIKEGGRLVL